MTYAIASLVEDARKSGYQVTTDQHGTTTIKKVYGRHKHLVKGLAISDTGWAYRLDVRLDLVAGIRRHDVMRQILGI